MRIPGGNGPERGGQVDRARSSAKKAGAGAATSASGGSGGTTVTASVSAKARTLAADHGIDIDKVERLRDAIQSGSFQMDFQRIANRIVQEGA